MAHCINVGKTDNGKTTFTVDHVFPAAETAGTFKGVIIFDKNFSSSPRWRKNHNLPVLAFSDLEEFLDAIYSNVDHIVVVDECALIGIKEQEDHLVPCAVTCCHLGHLLIVQAQRAKSIRPTVREQTSAYAVFNQNPDSIKCIMEVHHDEILKGAVDLDVGEGFFRVGPRDEPKRGRLF